MQASDNSTENKQNLNENKNDTNEKLEPVNSSKLDENSNKMCNALVVYNDKPTLSEQIVKDLCPTTTERIKNLAYSTACAIGTATKAAIDLPINAAIKAAELTGAKVKGERKKETEELPNAETKNHSEKINNKMNSQDSKIESGKENNSTFSNKLWNIWGTIHKTIRPLKDKKELKIIEENENKNEVVLEKNTEKESWLSKILAKISKRIDNTKVSKMVNKANDYFKWWVLMSYWGDHLKKYVEDTKDSYKDLNYWSPNSSWITKKIASPFISLAVNWSAKKLENSLPQEQKQENGKKLEEDKNIEIDKNQKPNTVKAVIKSTGFLLGKATVSVFGFALKYTVGAGEAALRATGILGSQ